MIEVAKEHRIRLARPNETNRVCDILGSAFSQDPVMHWMNTHPEIYASMFRSSAVPLYFKQGLVFINESQTGAAMWTPPGVSHEAPMHWTVIPMLWKMFRTGGIQSLKRGTKLEQVFKQHHYRKPHYYLNAIGAVMGQQGKGIGSAILKAGLEQCDRSHQEAYLESTNIKNNPLYERFGFKVTEEIALPDGGPKMWLMLREAR